MQDLFISPKLCLIGLYDYGSPRQQHLERHLLGVSHFDESVEMEHEIVSDLLGFPPSHCQFVQTVKHDEDTGLCGIRGEWVVIEQTRVFEVPTDGITKIIHWVKQMQRDVYYSELTFRRDISSKHLCER